MKYIDVDKLITEIEKRAKFHDDAIKACTGLNSIAITHSAGWKEDTELLTIIDSLQQEQTEVDLEKEVEKFCLEYDSRKEVWFDMTPRDKKMLSIPTWSNFAANIAHHFYELGKLNMRKDVISNNKSSLPSNLEEVAEEYANKEYPDEPCVGRWGTGDYEPPVDNEYPREIAKDAFKEGAEWAIKQLKEK